MTAALPTVTVKYSELLDAFEFVSVAQPFEHSAYINVDTGVIYWVSTALEVEEEVPDDIETSDHYIMIPHKNELDLGRRLPLAFADQEFPGDYDTIVGFFRKKGAYGRFKNFLEGRNLLERWYEFEARATKRALRDWCEENGVALVEEPTPT